MIKEKKRKKERFHKSWLFSKKLSFIHKKNHILLKRLSANQVKNILCAELIYCTGFVPFADVPTAVLCCVLTCFCNTSMKVCYLRYSIIRHCWLTDNPFYAFHLDFLQYTFEGEIFVLVRIYNSTMSSKNYIWRVHEFVLREWILVTVYTNICPFF